MKLLKYTLSFVLLLTMISCKEEKPEYPKFVFIFNNAINNDIKEGDVFPNTLKKLVNYYENKDEDSKCFGKIFAPDVHVKRLDLNKAEKIGMALSPTGKMQKSFGTLSKVNLKSMYDINLLKVPKLLIKENKRASNNSSKISAKIYQISLNANNKDIEKLRKKILSELCEGKSTIEIFINTEKKDETVEITKPDEISKTEEETLETIKTDEGQEKPIKVEKPKKKIPDTSNQTVINTKTTKLYKYVGGLKNNQPDGQGTMTFLKDGYVPIKGLSKHKDPVKAGDQLTGVFKKGYCLSGMLYDKNGKKKGAVFGGQ